eukprot:4091072-Pleurochrysis_carterae.AAC.1
MLTRAQRGAEQNALQTQGSNPRSFSSVPLSRQDWPNEACAIAILRSGQLNSVAFSRNSERLLRSLSKAS